MSKKTPQIRFKGFTDDWEERKLGDVGDTFTGLTGKTKEDFGHGSAKFVTYVNVFQNPIATLDQLDAVEIDEKQNQVQKGDVFFTTSSETPEEVGMSSVWTYDTKNVYLNSFTFGYRPRVSFDLNYMASMLRSPSIRKKITFLAQGISRYNISKTKMLEIEIPAPNLSEQKKIGSFFKLLDDTIALHQRKLDLLKEQKKGYLQKMFPKNGAKVPELRFAGFADDWEERKLNENVENIGTGRSSFKAGLDYSEQTPYEVLGSTSVISYSDSFDHSGNFVLTARVGANAGNLYKHSGNVKISDNTVYIQSKNLEFIFYLLTKYDLKKLAFGTGQPLIKASELKNLKLFFPKKFGEQQKIGSFFKQLDETIALHQRKLDLLKEQKKGFLQKMFVS
ncbi:restriction endonuclease subunit S [Leuconostoc mesenteroides]|uniref:restriction endonuclease subunit S n=1 Tax=Leuconostoc mesenteroides TaxID=1245 RepID=UPI0021D07F54|nr:restriction endonuclease subunit S [Leuconostoc mesenteroides]MCU4664822.1 restriction endonuclease subunit S [Leuconostoc mesenteroides]